MRIKIYFLVTLLGFSPSLFANSTGIKSPGADFVIYLSAEKMKATPRTTAVDDVLSVKSKRPKVAPLNIIEFDQMESHEATFVFLPQFDLKELNQRNTNLLVKGGTPFDLPHLITILQINLPGF